VADSSKDTPRRCFVIMPITTPASYADSHADNNHFQHVMDHLFQPALELAGYIAIPPSVVGSELIHAEVVKHLEQAELVLCDLSSLNPNVLFELGIRTSLDRAVAVVKDNLTASIPFDINAMNIFTYDGSLMPWTLDGEVEKLATHIKNVTVNLDEGNAMWRYFGLTKRARPSDAGSNPIEAKLDLIFNELLWQRTPPGPNETEYAPVADTHRQLRTEIADALTINGVTPFSMQFQADDSILVISTAVPLPRSAKDKVMDIANKWRVEVRFN